MEERRPLLVPESRYVKTQAVVVQPSRRCSCRVVAMVTVALATLIIAITVAFYLTSQDGGRSRVGEYTSAAVVSDHEDCSRIGRDILRIHNGSAVDAAVAMVLCIGATGAQASGIGGENFIMIYDRPKGGSKQEAFVINGRSKAPLAASRDMFENVTSSARGVLSISVPGELMSLHEAWSRFGRLPWRRLVQPTIDVCTRGFRVTATLALRIQGKLAHLQQFPNLGKMILKTDGRPYLEGDTMTRPLLADTLRRLADDGPLSFYNGPLADDVILDLEDAGSIISRKDLELYTAPVSPPLAVSIANDTLDLYVPLLPSGGPVLQFMLRVLEGLVPTLQSSEALTSNADLHQALVETFKFGFALRSFLGDDNFVDMDEVMSNLTSPSFIEHVRSQIDLAHTHPLPYYGSAYLPAEDHGTSHVSVMSQDGGAVSITTSVNTYFGSLVVGERTGILFNSGMDDFSSPHQKNDWGIRPSEANYIAPEKRPLSSMAPAIIVDHVTGLPKVVTGGAGGSQITTMVALTTFLNLYQDVDLPTAIDFPRVHHQLLPNVTKHEPDVSKAVLGALEARGQTPVSADFLAVVNSIERRCDSGKTCRLLGVGDKRRDAFPDGW